MSNCLITTLKESVNDDSLLKLGEMKLSVDSTSVVGINWYAANNCTMTIVGDGYFTDSTGSSNLGKTVTKSGETTVYSSAGKYDIVVEKYKVSRLNILTLNVVTLDFDDFTGVPFTWCEGSIIADGDLDTVFKLPNIIRIAINFKDYIPHDGNINLLSGKANFAHFRAWHNPKLTGDLSAFENMPYLNNLGIENCPNVTGNLDSLSQDTALTKINIYNNSNIEGNLTAVSNITSLILLQISKCSKITGSLASLARLTNLTTLNLDGTSVSGDTSSLAGLTNLTTFTYANTAITGSWPLT